MTASACEKERELPPADQTYTVRGRIESLPAKEGGEMRIHHESIEDFVDATGKKVGMKAMTMPFTPAASVSTKDLKAGDKIELRFEVRWESEPMLRVTRVQKLPPDTKLEFE